MDLRAPANQRVLLLLGENDRAEYAGWETACRPRRPCEPDMCRNIKTLFNFDPPVTDEEIRAASLQFVRKISGFTKPSQANEAAFAAAVDEVVAVSARLLASLETNAPAKNREEEAAKAKTRAAVRFSR